jgi:hypothetical protein
LILMGTGSVDFASGATITTNGGAGGRGGNGTGVITGLIPYPPRELNAANGGGGGAGGAGGSSLKTPNTALRVVREGQMELKEKRGRAIVGGAVLVAANAFGLPQGDQRGMKE